MTKVAVTETYLGNIANAIRGKNGLADTYTPSEMASAISNIPTINNQNKTVTPTTSQQSVTADSGYTGLGTVTVNAMPTGAAGTPSASKGAVSNYSVNVTPSVVNTTGYITGGTKTGTAVSVSASELVSGSQTLTTNDTYDVTNLASVIVNVSGGGIGTLLGTTSLGTLSTTSTTATDTGLTVSVSGVNEYDLLIVETSVDPVVNNRHVATVRLVFLTASSNINTKNGTALATAAWNTKISSSAVATTRASTTVYGVYPYSCTLSNGSVTMPIYYRYNSTSTGTLNGAYTTRVYGVKLYDLVGG